MYKVMSNRPKDAIYILNDIHLVFDGYVINFAVGCIAEDRRYNVLNFVNVS